MSAVAVAIQYIAEAFGVFFAVSALVVQLHALCMATVFMTRHASRVPFPSPITAPASGLSRKLVHLLAGPTAWKGL